MRILIAADANFDIFSIRRIFKGNKFENNVEIIFSFEDLKNKVVNNNLKTDVLIIDFGASKNINPQKCSHLFLSETSIPIIGLFNPANEQLIIEELQEGIDGYVIKTADTKYLELLLSVLKKVAFKKDEFSEIEQMKKRLSFMVKERNAFLNASLTLVTYHKPNTEISWSNAFMEEDEDKSVDHLAGRKCNQIWKHGGISDGRCPIATTFETGESVEAEVITLDGYTMLQRSYPVKNREGKVVGVMGSTLDISAISPAQEALKTAARIQASATLAGEIAHKFNNLMSGVMGNVSLAIQDIGSDHAAINWLEEIENAAKTAGDLSEQLLAFARGGKYLPKVILLNDVIRETLQIHTNEMADNIYVSNNLTDELWNIEANQAQMSLLFTQIYNNAVDAIEDDELKDKESKSIEIVTENKEIKKTKDTRQPWLEPGKYVVLSIKDNGCGMNSKIKSKIFEPFFTTKKKGRGLGLSSAYGIVRNHDGHISVLSHEGKGTTVTVHFPAASNVAILPTENHSLEKVVTTKQKPPRGTETVLVVDDETMLLKAIKRLLMRLGYNVLDALNGEEAVEIASNYKGTIDITLLDMIMPGLDGMEAYRQLKEIRPSMKIIVMSGYDKGTYAKALLAAGAVAFLQKPVPVDVIAQEIRKALD